MAAIPARYALERGDWKSASQLKARESPFRYTDAMTWFARGLGAAHLRQVSAANESVAALKAIHDQLAKAGESYWARQVEIQETALGAWAAFAENKKEVALREMKAATELEDGTEKSAVTPGPLAPARELLGDMLLEMNEPKQAFEQFESTLTKEPGRFRAIYGAAHAAQLDGHRDVSQKYFLQLLESCAHSGKPDRPEILEARKAVSQSQP
jgi:Tfp pilus assembly protein PilF